MQRWTFPSFRLSVGTCTNSHRRSINPSPVKPQTHPRTNIQAYNPSPKYIERERTLHSRITKLKAHNDQLRQNIAKLESQSAYLLRLKQLEKEIEQLRKEGRELARREEEVKLVVERGEKEVEGAVREDDNGWVEDQEEDNGWIGGGGGDDGNNGDEATWERTSDEGTFWEGSVRREAEDLKEERKGRVRAWQLKVEEESLDGNKDEDEDNREVKQEAKDVANDSFYKWVEGMELVRGAEAWK